MAYIEVTNTNFADTIKDGITVLDFWAEWCGPCKRFGPIFEAVSDEVTDVTFGKVNTDDQQELAGGLGIQSIPTVMVFRDNILVFRNSGLINGTALKKVIEDAKALDMDEVRAKVAAQNS